MTTTQAMRGSDVRVGDVLTLLTGERVRIIRCRGVVIGPPAPGWPEGVYGYSYREIGKDPTLSGPGYAEFHEFREAAPRQAELSAVYADMRARGEIDAAGLRPDGTAA